MPREAKPYIERGWYVSRPFGEYLRLCRVDEGMTEAKRLLKLFLPSGVRAVRSARRPGSTGVMYAG
jgi:hypothetical protein